MRALCWNGVNDLRAGAEGDVSRVSGRLGDGIECALARFGDRVRGVRRPLGHQRVVIIVEPHDAVRGRARERAGRPARRRARRMIVAIPAARDG